MLRKNLLPLFSILFFTLYTLSLSATSMAGALIPDPPQVKAESYLMIEANTGKVIVSFNADQALPPASLTKMLTSYVASHEIDKGSISPEDMVRISVKAWSTGGSKMFVREGTLVSVNDLLKGIIIQSGNDASIALAEHLAGSEDAFADLMNRHAERLGMHNSHFVNATGLPAKNHYTTANDLATLAKAIINDYPEHYKLYAEKDFSYNGIKQPNRNRLLWRDSTVDGLKTGHTNEAGYCLVASAKNDNMRLITVVMGTKSEEARAVESQKLLTYGFRFFETVSPFQRNEPLTNSKVWMGANDEVKLGLEEDFTVTIPKGETNKIKTRFTLEPTLKAPIEAGKSYGKVNLSLNGQPLAELPLVALETVEQGGFFKRIIDYIILLITSLLK